MPSHVTVSFAGDEAECVTRRSCMSRQLAQLMQAAINRGRLCEEGGAIVREAAMKRGLSGWWTEALGE